MSAPERPAQPGHEAIAEPPVLKRALPAAAGQPAQAVWRETLFWLALALALGRFWRLSQWSLWEDEVFTLNDARAMLEGVWPKNPLGYVPFVALVKLLGPVPSEAAMRWFPALLGFLGVAGCGLLFAPLVGARRAAFSALIVSASSWHVYWSQNARAYTLAQDLALIGGALALRSFFAPQGAPRARHALAGLAFGLLSALVHPSAALLLIAWLAAALLLPRLGFGELSLLPQLSRRWLKLALPVALLLVLWLGRMWLDYFRAKSDSTALHLIQSSGWFFTPALLAAALFGSIGAWRERKASDALVALACLLSAGMAVANALFVRAAAQYLFVLLPFVALLASWPVTQRRESRAWRAAWMLALILPALADQGLYFLRRNGDRPPWKQAFAAVLEQRNPGDLVFTNCANVGEFYFAPASLNLRRPIHVQNLDRYSSSTEAYWARQPRRSWFVINKDRMDEWDPAAKEGFERMLASDTRLVANFALEHGLRDLDVQVYLRE